MGKNGKGEPKAGRNTASATPPEEPTFETVLSKLDLRSLRVLELDLMLVPRREIALQLNLSRTTLWRIQSRPEYRAAKNFAEQLTREAVPGLWIRVVVAAMATTLKRLKRDEVTESFLERILAGSGHLSGTLPQVGPTDPLELVLHDALSTLKSEQDVLDTVASVLDRKQETESEYRRRLFHERRYGPPGNHVT